MPASSKIKKNIQVIDWFVIAAGFQYRYLHTVRECLEMASQLIACRDDDELIIDLLVNDDDWRDFLPVLFDIARRVTLHDKIKFELCYEMALKQWYIASLLAILQEEIDEDKKCNAIECLWSDTNYLDTWRHFSYLTRMWVKRSECLQLAAEFAAEETMFIRQFVQLVQEDGKTIPLYNFHLPSGGAQ